MSDFVEIPGTNGQAFKKVIKAGSGAKPVRSARVKAHCSGFLDEAMTKKFDSSRDRGEPFEFVCGAGQVIQLWDHGFATAQVGERFILKGLPSFCYGARGFPPVIPANSTLYFDCELLGC